MQGKHANRSTCTCSCGLSGQCKVSPDEGPTAHHLCQAAAALSPPARLHAAGHQFRHLLSTRRQEDAAQFSTKTVHACWQLKKRGSYLVVGEDVSVADDGHWRGLGDIADQGPVRWLFVPERVAGAILKQSGVQC